MSNASMTVTSVAGRLRASGSVFAENEARLLLAAAYNRLDLDAMISRRAAGLPIEHIVGWAEFCGHHIVVEYGVFVPRPRTEFLVEQAVARTGPGAVVVDLCTGSGAIAAAIAAATGIDSVYATDIDSTAAQCARRNLTAGHVFEGDLFDPLPVSLRGRVDVAVANTPYVPSREIDRLPREARLYEQRVALDGGTDGLDIQRRIAASARTWLAPGGRLLVETSERQAPTTAEIFERSGLAPSIARSDKLDATVVIGAVPQRSRATRPSSHTASSDS